MSSHNKHFLPIIDTSSYFSELSFAKFFSKQVHDYFHCELRKKNSPTIKNNLTVYVPMRTIHM